MCCEVEGSNPVLYLSACSYQVVLYETAPAPKGRMLPARRKPAAQVVSLGQLNLIARQQDELVARVRQFAGPLVDVDEEEPPRGTIWEAMVSDEQCKMLTNMTRAMITSLYQSMAPHIAAVKRRGPPPASSWMDSLLCYLLWARSPGKDFDKLAAAVGIPAGRFADNVGRVRPVLHAALCSRWLSPPARPQALVGTNFPHIGVLLDCHTTEGFRPKAPFLEGKIYYDGKNKIYGLKSELGVDAHPPHYCKFTANHTPASVHDYEYHKHNYQLFLPHLLKTPGEHHALPNDVQQRFWAVCGDKGYVGPETDTPDERRITPKKGPLTQEDRARNTEINRIRVPVEQFFGRMLSSWGLLHGVYRWDHVNFDFDFRICALLTNELIRHNQLAELDHDFYTKYLSTRRTEAEQRHRKRQEQLQRYANAKRARRQDELQIAALGE